MHGWDLVLIKKKTERARERERERERAGDLETFNLCLSPENGTLCAERAYFSFLFFLYSTTEVGITYLSVSLLYEALNVSAAATTWEKVFAAYAAAVVKEVRKVARPAVFTV